MLINHSCYTDLAEIESFMFSFEGFKLIFFLTKFGDLVKSDPNIRHSNNIKLRTKLIILLICNYSWPLKLLK